jgi:hypothetical protein
MAGVFLVGPPLGDERQRGGRAFCPFTKNAKIFSFLLLLPFRPYSTSANCSEAARGGQGEYNTTSSRVAHFAPLSLSLRSPFLALFYHLFLQTRKSFQLFQLEPQERFQSKANKKDVAVHLRIFRLACMRGAVVSAFRWLLLRMCLHATVHVSSYY